MPPESPISTLFPSGCPYGEEGKITATVTIANGNESPISIDASINLQASPGWGSISNRSSTVEKTISVTATGALGAAKTLGPVDLKQASLQASFVFKKNATGASYKVDGWSVCLDAQVSISKIKLENKSALICAWPVTF